MNGFLWRTGQHGKDIRNFLQILVAAVSVTDDSCSFPRVSRVGGAQTQPSPGAVTHARLEMQMQCRAQSLGSVNATWSDLRWVFLEAGDGESPVWIAKEVPEMKAVQKLFLL